MNNDPIFILGCTKSGTSLIRNLFDGHSQIFAVPTESHFFQQTGSWVYYFFNRSHPKNLSFDEMKNQLVEWIDFSNKRANSVGDGFTAGKWNMSLFKETLFSKQVSSLKELSDLYVESMYLSLYNKPFPNLRFLEKSVENTEFALEWLQMYPQAKFIHILRNPYSNLVAIRKFLYAPRFPFLNRALLSMYNSYYFLYKNNNLINSSQYKIILYEDLLKEPEKTMQTLAEFLQISFEEILLKPTILGEAWSGNSSRKVSFSGISKDNLDKWKKEITKYEVSVVNELFPHVLRDFNYEVIDPKTSNKTLLPKEGVINYIMNKLSYYYLPKPRSKNFRLKHE